MRSGTAIKPLSRSNLRLALTFAAMMMPLGTTATVPAPHEGHLALAKVARVRALPSHDRAAEFLTAGVKLAGRRSGRTCRQLVSRRPLAAGRLTLPLVTSPPSRPDEARHLRC